MREADEWQKVQLKGKQEPGAFVYIPGETIAQAWMGSTSDFPDLTDPAVRERLVVRRTPLQSGRKTAKVVLEFRVLEPGEDP
jgi:hypothetical protein